MDKVGECVSGGEREGRGQVCVMACSHACVFVQVFRGSRSPGLPSTPELKRSAEESLNW